MWLHSNLCHVISVKEALVRKSYQESEDMLSCYSSLSDISFYCLRSLILTYVSLAETLFSLFWTAPRISSALSKYFITKTSPLVRQSAKWGSFPMCQAEVVLAGQERGPLDPGRSSRHKLGLNYLSLLCSLFLCKTGVRWPPKHFFLLLRSQLTPRRKMVTWMYF